MTLRLVERYISYQGEGPNTGLLTMFVRFAGCNFKCPGWPCDTQHAIDPKIFTKTQQHIEPDTLIDRILGDSSVNNICFTGGEPFLQNHEDLLQVWAALKNRGRTIEVFTNGSLEWPDVDLVDTIILDWKLPGSGEFPSDEHLLDNIRSLGESDAIKFTIKDRDDFDRALFNYTTVILPLEASRPVVWCGPVWGSLTPEKLSMWMKNAEVPWRLNVQVHKYVFGADTIGV